MLVLLLVWVRLLMPSSLTASARVSARVSATRQRGILPLSKPVDVSRSLCQKSFNVAALECHVESDSNMHSRARIQHRSSAERSHRALSSWASAKRQSAVSMLTRLDMLTSGTLSSRHKALCEHGGQRILRCDTCGVAPWPGRRVFAL